MINVQKSLPDFLSEYGSFYSHMQSLFDNVENTEKGQKFAEFARDLVPHTEIGKSFNVPELRPPSHDGGVDLEANAKESSSCLYIQSKYTIRSVDDLDAIIGKFKAFEDEEFKKKAELTAKQMDMFAPADATDADTDREEIHYMIFTASEVVETRKLKTYEKSTRLSLPFYQNLKDSQRLHILDGRAMVAVAQNSYRKKHFMPSDMRLELVTSYIPMENVYIGVISGLMLRKLYDDYGDSLFLENIREWLGPYTGKQKQPGRETVNEAISRTLHTEPEKFLSRNNGITFRANAIQILSDSTLHLGEASIVNGCQTTMAIVKAGKLTDDCRVLIKIVETDDAWDIAGSANFQTKIGRIDIDLARYIRSEAISLAADKYGIHLRREKNIPESIFSVFRAISQESVIESEIRAIFIGLFSRTPHNAIASNYTELRDDLLNEYNLDAEKDEVLYMLFILSNRSGPGTRCAGGGQPISPARP